jgi:hypothetical protein
MMGVGPRPPETDLMTEVFRGDNVVVFKGINVSGGETVEIVRIGKPPYFPTLGEKFKIIFDPDVDPKPKPKDS